jgi:HlyD family secretion protein
MITVKTQNASIFAELESVESSLDIIEDQISRAIIENPVNGTVLEKYVEPYELVNAGKPLYKIADLSEMILRAYVSGDQLDDFKIGQKVKVEIDSDAESNHTFEGEIIWVSAEAEFTPKIIQTKEERVNLVYAIKVKVVNDGKIKIGMPGEVWL